MGAKATFATLPLLAVLVACSGSGGPAGPGPGDPYPLSSLDEVCDDALRGRDVLDTVQGEYAETLRYLGSPGTTPITLHLSYAGGPITCLPHVSPPPGSGAPEVPARVEVEVDMELETGDGLFRERFAAPLTGSLGVGAGFQATLAAGELGGSYDPDMPEHEDVTVSFSGGFEAMNANGSIWKGGRRPGMAPETRPVAAWGP